MTPDHIHLETLRKRALELLQLEGRPVHTGMLATLLQVPTHQVHTALHNCHLQGVVRFTSSEGWALIHKAPPAAAAEQQRIDG